MINAIVSYKKSVAIFAAYEMGLFDYIKKNRYFDLKICEAYRWDKDVFRLLCLYLKDEGILVEQNNSWYLSNNAERKIEAISKILEHEKNLYDRWITPEKIIDAIREGYGKRKFDKYGFSNKEKVAYDKTMYSSNLNVITFELLHKIQLNRILGIDVLEYGRSYGEIARVLQKYVECLNITSLSFEDKLPAGKKYNLIMIYNSIHYRQEWENMFKKFFDILKNDGILCIIDIFYDNHSDFLSTILMDWITHGGIYNIYSADVCNTLTQVGFKDVQKTTVTTIAAEMIYAYKR